MALWFLDTTNGDDANDGKASKAVTFTGKTLNYISGTYRLVDSAVAAAVSVGDILYITSATAPAQAAWWSVTANDDSIVTLELFSGAWVATSRTDCTSVGSAPFKTFAHLFSVYSAGDWVVTVDADGDTAIEPSSEIVALALKAKLETITIANGYAIDIGTVLRPTSLGWPEPDDKHVIIDQVADRIAEDPATMFEHHKLEFVLYLMIRSSESDTVPLDTWANRYHAAVRKALIADVTLGGVCIDLDVGDAEQVDFTDPVATYALSVVATYRHADTDPYTA